MRIKLSELRHIINETISSIVSEHDDDVEEPADDETVSWGGKSGGKQGLAPKQPEKQMRGWGGVGAEDTGLDMKLGAKKQTKMPKLPKAKQEMPKGGNGLETDFDAGETDEMPIGVGGDEDGMSDEMSGMGEDGEGGEESTVESLEDVPVNMSQLRDWFWSYVAPEVPISQIPAFHRFVKLFLEKAEELQLSTKEPSIKKRLGDNGESKKDTPKKKKEEPKGKKEEPAKKKKEEPKKEDKKEDKKK